MIKFLNNFKIKYNNYKKEYLIVHITLEIFFAIIFCLVISEIIFLLSLNYFEIEKGLNFQFLLTISYVYIISAIILSIIYVRIFNFSKISKYVEKFNLGYEAIVCSTLLSLWIHVILVLILDIPILVLRFVGFGFDLYLYTLFNQYLLKNIHVDLSLFRYNFKHTNIED